MKEQLLELIGRAETPVLGVHRAREYLQATILLALQEAGAMIPLAFRGGTALRLLFGLPRFSEDLDFALERPDRSGFDLVGVGERVTAHLKREGYHVVTRSKTDRAVQSLMVSFPGLLHQAGLSPHTSQRLSIRVEVDTQPPSGAGLMTTVVRRHTLMNLQHHDRASLLAGKLHAVLQRNWTKGRDLFDLFWYVSEPTWPGPNLVLLNNALRQTGGELSALEESTWRSVVRDRVEAADWTARSTTSLRSWSPAPPAPSSAGTTCCSF